MKTHSRKLVSGFVAIGLAAVLAVAGVSVASGASAPKKANIKAVQTLKVKVNRYIQDGLRWDKDKYAVASGGTIHLVQNAPDPAAHTLTVVAKKDLPKTVKQILGCKICESLGEAHGADPNSDAPPKFPFLENGTGQATAPTFDKAGDSAYIDAKKGATLDLKVGAKKGSELYVICLIHPWMQAKVAVK